MNLISGILIAGVLTMSGCSSIKQLDIFTMEVERQPLDLEKPTIQQLEELKWIIITSENADEVFKKLGLYSYHNGQNTYNGVAIVSNKPLTNISLDLQNFDDPQKRLISGEYEISKNNKVNFKEGMIVSNEPGYYENGKFGIRIENLIRVKKSNKGYSFDNLTMVPIDKSLINKNILKKSEINWLNSYHRDVFNNLKNFMDKSELFDLRQACSKI